MRMIRQNLAYILLLVLLPAVLFWRWVLFGDVLFWGAPLFQFWPWRYLAKSALLAGEWPLWNPWVGNGAPLLANLQTAVFYPLNALFLLLPVEDALTFSVLLHLSLAGVLMYLYCRVMDLAPYAATVAALTYMLSGYLTGRTQFVVMINAAAWIPLILLLCEFIVQSKRPLIPAVWLGVVLAIQILAGHAQLCFYSLVLMGGYTLVRAGQVNRTVLAVGQSLAWLSMSVGLMILLAMAQLLPTAEYTLESPRGTGAERTFALTYSLWPWRLVTFVAPDFFGNPAEGTYWGYANYWEDHAYLGVLPFLLAILGAWIYFRARPAESSRAVQAVPFFVALVPVSVILAFGWNTPIYLLVFDYVPGFGYFQAPARLLIWYTVGMSFLAGFGAQYFHIAPTRRARWRRLLAASIAMGLVGVAGSFYIEGRPQTFMWAAGLCGGWLTVSIILLLWRPRTERLGWQWTTLAIIAVDLLWVALPLSPMTFPGLFRLDDTPPATEYRQFVLPSADQALKFDYYFRFEDFGSTESYYWRSFIEAHLPNTSLYRREVSSNNADPLVVGHWRRLVDFVDEADAASRQRVLRLMNVTSYVDTPLRHSPTLTETPVYLPADIITRTTISEPLPRAYFVPHAVEVATETDALARIAAPDFDSAQEIVIIKAAPSTAPANDNQAAASVTIEAATAQRVTLRAETPTDGYIVLTDTFYPGWHATVNGADAPILRANVMFRAVAVGAGSQMVTFTYQPWSFTLGLWLSGAGLAVVIIMLGLCLKFYGFRTTFWPF